MIQPALLLMSNDVLQRYRAERNHSQIFVCLIEASGLGHPVHVEEFCIDKDSFMHNAEFRSNILDVILTEVVAHSEAAVGFCIQVSETSYRLAWQYKKRNFQYFYDCDPHGKPALSRYTEKDGVLETLESFVVGDE